MAGGVLSATSSGTGAGAVGANPLRRPSSQSGTGASRDPRTQPRVEDTVLQAETQALAFGSAAYMPPERLMGDPDAPAGDVFALGITLFELLRLKGVAACGGQRR